MCFVQAKVWPAGYKNRESVAELWIGLLRFYTEEFNLRERVICIRRLAPLTKFEKLWNRFGIAIEDPFNLDHNLGSGVSRKSTYFSNSFFFTCRRDVVLSSLNDLPCVAIVMVPQLQLLLLPRNLLFCSVKFQTSSKQMIPSSLLFLFNLVNLYIQKVLRKGRKLFGTPFDRQPFIYETIQVNVVLLTSL
jgi:hypothetical protein